MAKAKGNARLQNTEPGGLWHQPALMNLIADLLIVLAAAVLGWSALTALQRLPVFPLRELVLTTLPRQVDAGQIEHAARRAVSGNFFTVDLDATRDAFEKLPWVRKATVRRQWPDGLLLTLEEHEAVARWRHPGKQDGGGSLVNRQGELFSAELPTAASALPLFVGPEGSAPQLLNRHAEFAAVLAGIGRQIDTVMLSPRQAWRVRLDDGMALELGRDQERHPLAERLERFVAHYEIAKARLGTVLMADMRYPNGFAMGGVARTATPPRQGTQERKS